MIYLALGSNRQGLAGDPIEMMLSALRLIESRGQIRVRKMSSFYRSESWPDPSKPKFLNGVVSVDTNLQPALLLASLHGIERQLGRRRTEKNAPRSIDLDLVDYHGRAAQGGVSGPELPHPRLHQRAFVLAPLVEIRPNWRHPTLNRSGFELLKDLGPGNCAQRLE